MEHQYEEEIEIDLKELFFVLWNEIKLILLSAVLMAAIVFVFNKFVLTPQYAATSKLYILSKSTSITSMADLQIGSNLTQDYMVIIKGRTVVDTVIENLQLDETYESLSEKIAITNPSDTRILNITITCDDPKEAKQIADEFAVVASAYIAEKMDQDPPNIIENAFVNENPVGPSTMKNTVLGFIIGFVLMCGIIIVVYIMDDTLNDPEQIEKHLGLNTLASIPISSSVSRNMKEKSKEKDKKKRKERSEKRGKKQK